MGIIRRRGRPLRRFVVFLAVVILAMVVAALTADWLPGWAAAALGVVLGAVTTVVMEAWDDRHAPDLVANTTHSWCGGCSGFGSSVGGCAGPPDAPSRSHMADEMADIGA